jgi:hypothetical protein
VRVFRRRSDSAAGTVTQDPPGGGPGTQDAIKTARSPAEAAKGRPTPKRSEAERRRRQPVTAPAGRSAGGKSAGGKAASPQSKTRDRAERARKYEAMKRGEDWALPPRDKGPVRAIARDYVDSRRRASEYYMYVLLLLMVMVFTRAPAVQAVVYPLVVALFVVLVLEGLLVRRGVRKLAAERCPGESVRGVTMYSTMRALQIRRFRVPAPRVGPGVKPAS